MNNLPTTILDGLGVTALVIAGAFALFGLRSKQNDSASTELINKLTKLREADKEESDRRLNALEVQLTDMRNQRKKDGEAIAHLQGQLDTYKNLPLKDWAETMQVLSGTNMKTEAQLITIADTNAKILTSNQDILTTLQKSAFIAATDREILTNPSSKQIISEQVVDHQVIRSKE